jgi:hypothetical protein
MIARHLRYFKDYALILYIDMPPVHKVSYTLTIHTWTYHKQALVGAYGSILSVCREVRLTFKKDGKIRRRKYDTSICSQLLTTSSGISLLALTINPWNQALDNVMKDFKTHLDILKKELIHADRLNSKKVRDEVINRFQNLDLSKTKSHWLKCK